MEANFGGCGADANRIYLSTTLTVEHKRTLLAVFLTAKSTGAPVSITYTRDAGTADYCRMTFAEIQ